MSTSTPLLIVEEVWAGYVPEAPILQGVQMVVQAGELVTIIGTNGAGKSTLARTIFGLVPVRQGTIHFQGENITGWQPEQIVRAGMGYVPQVSNVFPNLTVSENLEMGGYLAEGIAAKKQDIYNIFPPLARRKRQAAGTLSGGERQMLAMGRALMLSPKLLILDEPSAALSPILVQEIFALIAAINRGGTAIVLVEQNARRALTIAQRAYVMDNGKERYTGKGEDLLNDPRIAELYLGVGHLSSI